MNMANDRLASNISLSGRWFPSFFFFFSLSLSCATHYKCSYPTSGFLSALMIRVDGIRETRREGKKKEKFRSVPIRKVVLKRIREKENRPLQATEMHWCSSLPARPGTVKQIDKTRLTFATTPWAARIDTGGKWIEGFYRGTRKSCYRQANRCCIPPAPCPAHTHTHFLAFFT